MAEGPIARGQREKARELMRDLLTAVVLPLLADVTCGREPSPVLTWRLRAGLSLLRRNARWSREETAVLLRALKAAEGCPSRDALLELCEWLGSRVHGE